jgi:site-specific DNA recombinase
MLLCLSTADQLRGNSFETQLEECTALCNQLGCRPGRVYREVESARKTEAERAHYRQLIKDAEAGRFQVLIVWKIDRFTRNTIDGLRVLKHLVDDLGIELQSVTERIDTKSADGRRNLRNAISEAEYEVERLIERVKPGMIRGVQKGHWQGARYCFYGYHYDKALKKPVEIAEEIQTLRIVYRLAAEGIKVYSIALRLADMGIRNRVGKLFTTHQLEVILRRSFYVNGHLVWRYRDREQGWQEVRSEKPVVEPAIDRETWERVQAVNQQRRQAPRTPSPGRVTSPYVLQGVLKCRFCGGNMVGQRCTSNHRTGEKAPWYTCGQRLQRTRKACPGQYVKAEAAHKLAFDILKKVLRNPQVIELTRQYLSTALEHGQPQLFKRVRDLRETIRRVKQAQAKWRQAFFNEAITEQQFKEENLQLVREQEAAEQELRTVEAKLHGADAFKGKLDEVFGLLQDFETVWSRMSPVKQRVVYRGAFNYLKVEGAKWSRQFRMEDFSLKPLFESWYHGRAWNGPLLLSDADLGIVTDKQDKELCQSSIFAPMDAR